MYWKFRLFRTKEEIDCPISASGNVNKSRIFVSINTWIIYSSLWYNTLIKLMNSNKGGLFES